MLASVVSEAMCCHRVARDGNCTSTPKDVNVFYLLKNKNPSLNVYRYQHYIRCINVTAPVVRNIYCYETFPKILLFMKRISVLSNDNNFKKLFVILLSMRSDLY